MQLFHAAPREHVGFARQLAAEKPEEVFKPGMQPRTVWKRVYYRNHWLDAGYLACVAGHLAGVRLLADRDATPKPITDWFAPCRANRRLRRGSRRRGLA